MIDLNTGIQEAILEKKWRFSVSFVLVFFTTFSMLGIIGIVPSSENDERSSIVQSVEAREDFGEPVRIVIDSVDIDWTISNPESTSIAVLDEALREGVVRYPGSGMLSDTSNMFLFGHSSYLPVVYNPAYQVFNNLENTQVGDYIRVYSDTVEYIYKVISVSLVDASEALVEFETGVKKLTLSTCNSFGSKEERYIVEADFVGSYPLKS